MRRYILFLFLLLNVVFVFGQPSRITNTKLSLSSAYDTLIVEYNLKGDLPMNNVTIEIKDSAGNEYIPKSIKGDIGNNVLPGRKKQIVWNMTGDGVSFSNKSIFVNVTGDVFIPYKEPALGDLDSNNNGWFNWWFVAAGASAVTAGTLHLISNNIYNNKYPISDATLNAEDYRQRVDNLDMARNIFIGAAGAFAITGVVVQVKHNQQKHEVALSYVPLNNGGVVGLTYKF